MQIDALRCGERAQIIGFHAGDPSYRHKLLAMGLTPGSSFTLTRIAPLGDPIEIIIRGYALSLRKREAAILLIKRLDEVA